MAHFLVMAKAPIPGLVKTRLRLAPDKAAALQRALIQDTAEKARALGPATVAGTPPDHLSLIAALLPGEVKLVQQVEGNLGDKMLRAAEYLFEQSPEPVVVLGTDSPTLPPGLISRASHALDDHDACIVPSTDGGYVLLGLREPHEALFAGVEWSTEAVCGQTLARAEQAGLSVYRQQPWYDVDTPQDLAQLTKDLAANPEIAPHTAEVLRKLL